MIFQKTRRRITIRNRKIFVSDCTMTEDMYNRKTYCCTYSSPINLTAPEDDYPADDLRVGEVSSGQRTIEAGRYVMLPAGQQVKGV